MVLLPSLLVKINVVERIMVIITLAMLHLQLDMIEREVVLLPLLLLLEDIEISKRSKGSTTDEVQLWCLASVILETLRHVLSKYIKGSPSTKEINTSQN